MTAPQSPQDAPRGWLTAAEVCERLCIHPNTLTGLLAEGLPHLRIGNRIRVRESDLDAWTEARIIRLGGDTGDNEEVRERQSVPPPVRRPVDRSTPRRKGRLPVRDRDRRGPGAPAAGGDAPGTTMRSYASVVEQARRTAASAMDDAMRKVEEAG